MKKILSLLSVLTISGTAMPNVIAVKHYEKKENVRIKRQVNLSNLNNKIKNWMLGELSDNLPETILNQIYKLNKNIKKNSLRILNVQQNTAKIIWDEDDNYTTNFIHVFFTVNYIENNDKLVGNSIFYNINFDGRVCTSQQQIKKNQRPKEAPPSPPATQIKEPIYATILSKSQRNKQNNVVPPRNLKNILLNINLGELSDNMPETIFERLILLNNNINFDEIMLSEITDNSAIISAIENSTIYLDSIVVHFTLNNAEIKNIKEYKNKQDPNSDTNNSVNKLISKFNKLCSNNEINNLNPKKVLTENTSGGRLHAGDTYLGTNNGIYLQHDHGQIDKFDGLNFPIIDIELDGKGSAYVLNNTGEVYHLNLDGWGHTIVHNELHTEL